MKYELIIFDLDGTLLDTLEDLTEAVNHAMRELGFPEHTLEEIRTFVGNGNFKLMERSIPEQSDEETLQKAFQLFHAYYGTHFAVKTTAYPGIPELLRALKEKGLKLAVVSNKADYAVQIICRTYFDGIIDAALGDKEGIRKKPAPDPVFYILEQLSVSAEKTLYIGDSEVDLQTAAHAGLPCISVDWGFRSREQLLKAGAACIISSPEDILTTALLP